MKKNKEKDPRYIGAYKWHVKYVDTLNKLNQCLEAAKALSEGDRALWDAYCKKYKV